MKKSSIILVFIVSTTLSATTPELEMKYDQVSNNTGCSIYQHLPALRELTQECNSVVELGIGWLESTVGLFMGLSENPSSKRSYLGVDINSPREIPIFKRMASENGIECTFLQANDMHIDIPETELLFIDSLHTYCHLSYELEKFSPKAKKYIAMHDTSEPWGYKDEPYNGNYSEYPASIDRNKKGLWLAVEDFLAKHPEWTLIERRFNNHGFTVLKRIQ